MNAARPNGPAFAVQGAIEIDVTVLVYTAAVTLGTGLLFGLVPALIASRQDLAQALKDADHHASSGGRPLRARNLLVIAEVALALMLAVAATLATRSLASLHRTDLGFKVDNLMIAVVIPPPDRYPTSAALVQFWATLARRVAAIPGIQSATVSSGAPGLIGGHETFYLFGAAQTPENANIALAYRVDVGFPETLQIPLLAGRTCGEQDALGTVPVVVVSRRLAEKFFPGQDPVGQRLQEKLSQQASVEIVGVVGDIRHEGLEAPEATPYQIHYCYRQLPLDAQKDTIVSTSMHLIARAGDASLDLAPQVRAALAEVDPMAPTWGISNLADILKGHLGAREFTVRLLSVFAAIALLLAAIGLYAVMANAVVQRTRELGVRLALGAQPRAIVALVVGQGMRLVAIGLGIGLLGALALTQVMETLLTDAISATDPPTYLGVTALLVTVGLLATWLPARRATRVDPMIAMRHDLSPGLAPRRSRRITRRA
jgi:putative ABC transport system permease protein